MDEKSNTFNESRQYESTGIWDKAKAVARLINIEPSLFLHMAAALMGGLVLSNLYLYKACSVNLGHKYNATFCEELVDKRRGAKLTPFEKEAEIQAQDVVTSVKMWTSIIDDSLPVFYVLFLGAWSDRFGRRVPYLGVITGYIIRYCLLIMAAYFTSWDAAILGLVSSIPVALTGSSTALSMIIYSYAADTTSIQDRTLKMVIVIAFRGLGNSVGQALGGQMSNAGWSYYTIFGIAGGLDLVSFVWAWFTITDPKIKGRTSEETQLQAVVAVFDLNHIKNAAVAFFRKRQNGDRTKLFLLVVVILATAMPVQAEGSNTYNFTRIQLNWNAGTYSLYKIFSMVVNFIGSMTGVFIMTKGLKLADPIIGIIGCISQISAGFVYFFTTTSWMMFLAEVVDVLSAMMSVVRSMISKIIPPHETGRVNSFISLIEAITVLPMSPIYGAIYKATIRTWPGTIFLVSAAITVPALLVFIYFAFSGKRKDTDHNLSVQELEQGSRTGSVVE